MVFGNTRRTYCGHFEHVKDAGEHPWIHHVQSRMRYSHQIFAPPSRLKPLIVALEPDVSWAERCSVQQPYSNRHDDYSQRLPQRGHAICHEFRCRKQTRTLEYVSSARQGISYEKSSSRYTTAAPFAHTWGSRDTWDRTHKNL